MPIALFGIGTTELLVLGIIIGGAVAAAVTIAVVLFLALARRR